MCDPSKLQLHDAKVGSWVSTSIPLPWWYDYVKKTVVFLKLLNFRLEAVTALAVSCSISVGALGVNVHVERQLSHCNLLYS